MTILDLAQAHPLLTLAYIFICIGAACDAWEHRKRIAP
jgi:hypothetical protein